MLCIYSLKYDYDNYLRNWFLTNFEGCYCYKDTNTVGGMIKWLLPKGKFTVILLIEYNNSFSPIYSAAIIHSKQLKEIIKKKNKKEN